MKLSIINAHTLNRHDKRFYISFYLICLNIFFIEYILLNMFILKQIFSFWGCTASGGVSVPCIYTHARRELATLRDSGLSCCYVFRALINSLFLDSARALWASFCFRSPNQGQTLQRPLLHASTQGTCQWKRCVLYVNWERAVLREVTLYRNTRTVLTVIVVSLIPFVQQLLVGTC